MSSAYRDNLISVCLCIFLISFSCLLAPASASRIMLKKKRADGDQSCLVLDFNMIALIFLH